MEWMDFGVLQKRTWQSIMVSVQVNSCCTSKRWNGDTTTEMVDIFSLLLDYVLGVNN